MEGWFDHLCRREHPVSRAIREEGERLREAFPEAYGHEIRRLRRELLKGIKSGDAGPPDFDEMRREASRTLKQGR